MGKPFGRSVELPQIATPANPPAGRQLLYPKSDGKWYTKLSTGVETEVIKGDDARLTNARVPTAHTHVLSDLPDAWAKRSVRAATTANITLSGTQTVDTIALVAGDRVLVKDQAAPAQNGIYVVVAAGAWTRATDANLSVYISGAQVVVDTGAVNGGHTFRTSFKSIDTLGTTAMPWAEPYSDLNPPTSLSMTESAGVPAVLPGQAVLTTVDGSALFITDDAGVQRPVDSSTNSGFVRAGTTANITLSGLQTIDSVAVVAGDRVLVRHHATPALCGIYVVSAGAWARASDADTSAKLAHYVATVTAGAVNGSKTWQTTFKPGDTLGTTGVSWYQTSVETVSLSSFPGPAIHGHTVYDENTRSFYVWNNPSSAWQQATGVRSGTSAERAAAESLIQPGGIWKDTGANEATYIRTDLGWDLLGAPPIIPGFSPPTGGGAAYAAGTIYIDRTAEQVYINDQVVGWVLLNPSTTDTGWVTITPGTGWAHGTETAMARTRDFVTRLRGTLKRTSGTATSMGTIPAGQRMPAGVSYSGFTRQGTTNLAFTINSSGILAISSTVVNTTDVELSGHQYLIN